MCSNIGTPKTINFPFGTNGKLMVLGVPIHKHFRVCLEKRQGVFLRAWAFIQINTVFYYKDLKCLLTVL